MASELEIALKAELQEEKAAHEQTYVAYRSIADQRDEALSRAEAAEDALAMVLKLLPSVGVARTITTMCRAECDANVEPIVVDVVRWLSQLDVFRNKGDNGQS